MPTKSPVTCPNCNCSFSVARLNAGKRAKCPKCEQPFVITFSEDEPSRDTFAAFGSEPPPVPVAPTPAQPPQPVINTTADDSPRRSKEKEKSSGLPQWAIIALPAVVTLVVGYFIGREHIKYQMRSALAGAASAFAEGFKQSASPRGSSIGSIDATDESIAQLMIGQSHNGDGFAIGLASAKIAKPKVKDMMGDLAEGKSPDLILTFKFQNTDDRRILRFREGNQFLAGHFRLRDDVDNVIRGIDYGFANKPVGALTGSEDIAPGESASHIELFSVPPPKTQFLVLTVDLACLGGDGLIEFKIPAASIAK